MGADTVYRVRKYRQKMRSQGLRLIQIWVPDTRKPNFKAECRRQSRLANEADLNDMNMLEIMDDAVTDVDGWTD